MPVSGTSRSRPLWAAAFSIACGMVALLAGARLNWSLTSVASALAGGEFVPPNAGGWGRAGGLAYWEAIRGGAQASEALPLLVLIHGLGGSPERVYLDLVASDVRARIIQPRAPETWGYGGFAWFPYRVRDRDKAAELAKLVDLRSRQLSRAIATLRAERPTRGAPIVAGFSQGAIMSLALAAREPDRYSFVLPISGLLPDALWPKTAPPGAARLTIRAIHGARDEIVPIEPARATIEHLKSVGFDAELVEFADLAHAIEGDLRARVVRELTAAARRIGGPQREAARRER